MPSMLALFLLYALIGILICWGDMQTTLDTGLRAALGRGRKGLMYLAIAVVCIVIVLGWPYWLVRWIINYLKG